VSGPGFATAALLIVGGQATTAQNGNASPQLSSGEFRIILTWGAIPSDLDTHLTGPTTNGGSRFHLYFFDKAPFDSNALLDLDDVSSSGPESTTMSGLSFGIYRYSVHDYSNRFSTDSIEMSNAGAKVRVITSSGEQEFNITPNVAATVWTVFEINGATGTVTPVNQFNFESDDENADSFKYRSATLYGEGAEDLSIFQEVPVK